MNSDQYRAPNGCQNPRLWRQAAELVASHQSRGVHVCMCGRIEPCTVRLVARRAQVRAMANGRAIGVVRLTARSGRM